MKKNASGCTCGATANPSNKSQKVRFDSDDYKRGLFQGAVEKGKAPPPKNTSAELQRGYAAGGRIAKVNAKAVAEALGVYSITSDQVRAGQALQDAVLIESEASMQRNPARRMSAAERKHRAHERGEEQAFASLLAKLPVGETVMLGKRRVRKLSKGYVVVDGERLTTTQAAVKIHRK